MDRRPGPRLRHAAKRCIVAALFVAGVGGCVYAPPYAAYDPYYPGYSYPTYVGPPVSIGLGFGYVEHGHGGYRGHHHHGHGWGHGHGRGHGWGRR